MWDSASRASEMSSPTVAYVPGAEAGWETEAATETK